VIKFVFYSWGKEEVKERVGRIECREMNVGGGCIRYKIAMQRCKMSV
jgi:hypothetical protein